MRIYEIAAGTKQELNVYSSKQKDDVFNVIRKHCSQILKIYRNTHRILYRGVSKASFPAFKGASRVDRQTHTNQDIANKISVYMQQAGLIATRVNSIACTANYRRADSFGKPYAIFPINGFQYSWSPKIEDFGIHIWQLKNIDPQDLVNSINLGSENPEYFIKDTLGYKNVDIEQALRITNEINITGEYYALDAVEFMNDIEEEFLL